MNEFEVSYQEIASLIRRLSEDDLLTSGRFTWTGKYLLTTYLGPNTCSHYKFAAKVLKRWLKRSALSGSVNSRQ